MRVAKSLRLLLTDLVEWGEKAERVVARTDSVAVVDDEQAELALGRVVEIVGEIFGRILVWHPAWARERNDEDLEHAYRMRNKLAHGYESISPARLYEIARNDVAVLTAKARRWLAELPDDQP